MLPTSIAGSIVIGWPSTVSPGLDRAHVGALEREVAARLDAAQVVVGLVGADDVAAVGDRVVEQDVDVRADRADVAGRADPVADLLVARRAETARRARSRA